MEKRVIDERLIEHMREYANGRMNDVKRGNETPKLAALLVQKYGRGMVNAVAIVFDDNRFADSLSRVVDEETTRIDPNWKSHDKERWAGHLVDVV